MDINEIKEGVKNKHWYYYYDFDGVEVNKKKKKDKSLGFHNWNKIKPIMKELFTKVENPHVLNIGCNMGLYDHEMTKIGYNVTAIDFNTDQIEFYKRYVIENKKEEWKVNIINIDVTKERLKSDSINIILMLCVLYHLSPNQDKVVKNLIKDCPNHRFLVLQGNLPRVAKKNQIEAGVPGMRDFLKKNSYFAPRHYVYEWNGYQKPVVIGERNISQVK
jgi:SAM-dependent methyltransferase